MPRVGQALAGRAVATPSTVGAGLATFAVGFGIGTALNHWFFHFNGAGIDPPTAQAASASDPVWQFPGGATTIGTGWGGPGRVVPGRQGAYLTFRYSGQPSFNAIPDGPGMWANDQPPHFNAVGHQDVQGGTGSITTVHLWATDNAEDVLKGAGAPTPNATPGELDPLNGGYAPPVTWPGDQAATDALQQQLNTGNYPHLEAFLDHQVAPETYPDPVSNTVEMPDCADLSYDACAGRLQDAGLTHVSHTVASFDEADLDKGADAVLSQSPAAGGTVNLDAEVEIHTNPSSQNMPVVVPAFDPAPGQSFASYASQLADLGLDAQEHQSAQDIAPGNVYETTPAPGTRVHRGDAIKAYALPPSTEQQRKQCWRGEPTEADPAWEEFSDPYSHMFDEYPNTDNPTVFALTYGSSPSATLRWGDVSVPAEEYDSPLDWQGWGYRHIAAEHGWTTQDQNDTRDALQAPIHHWHRDPQPDRLDSWVYVGEAYTGTFDPTQPSQQCWRVVIVDFAPGPGDRPAKGIITSYPALVKETAIPAGA